MIIEFLCINKLLLHLLVPFGWLRHLWIVFAARSHHINKLLLQLNVFEKLRLLRHPLGNSFQSTLNLFRHDSLRVSINQQQRSTIVEHLKRVKAGQVRLFILLRNNPRFDTIQNHIVDNNSVSHMNRLLQSQNAEYLKRSGSQIIK